MYRNRYQYRANAGDDNRLSCCADDSHAPLSEIRPSDSRIVRREKYVSETWRRAAVASTLVWRRASRLNRFRSDKLPRGGDGLETYND